ncbi:CPBP family intramembrane metalloprotease domain-containing protein [Dokdonia sp. Dokd-P16]|uniref:CPBP family intramembrane glutamic endopeptidase n=1 Tax=Dokdonia sp. Dokd-P16 TaxID=2173169 RepID=UPI000D544E0B|nr:CPBP family intramembrane glutamic endopeptidase [Dokdonia sp. Dokd-P16]AWH74610.1 CPBP family intramembrane metalloprotease domain-containing protein [Dokdonia sp. Dokd-P16]
MYIEQAYKSLHEGWRYIIGFLIIFILGWQILGLIPLMVGSWMRAGDINIFLEAGEANFFPLFEGESNLYLILALCTFLGGLLGLVVVVKYIHKQLFTKLVTARKKIDWSRFFFAFAIWGVFSVVSTLVAYYFAPEDLVWNFNLMPFLGLLAITLILLPLQTSFEEFLFRGYLMQGIGVAAGNKLVPLIITSLIFGLMHALNPEIEKLGYSILSVYIGLGFFLGIITLMDDGMELALGFHAANNMFIALLVTSDWSALQTNSIFRDVAEPSAIGQIVPIFIILPILMFIFARKYKWSNWKEKLTGSVKPPAAA